MKWTKDEDNELISHVERLGPAWHVIERRFSTKRSRNAIIKRWHTHLKEDYGDLQQLTEKDHSDSNYSDIQSEMESEELPQVKSPPSVKGPEQSVGRYDTHYNFNRNWTFEDDERLRMLVLERHEFDWALLARQFQVEKEQVVRRWQQKIYPQIRLNDKVAGVLKWSIEEDDVLMHCERIFKDDWAEVLRFLPSRSIFSIEARFKRLYLNRTAKNASALKTHIDGDVNRQLNKYEYRKHIIRKIAMQQRQAKEQQTIITS